jgi:hypothetical protein
MFTSSKLISWYIAIISSIYALNYESTEALLGGFALAAGVYGNKQYQDARKEINNNKERL